MGIENGMLECINIYFGNRLKNIKKIYDDNYPPRSICYFLYGFQQSPTSTAGLLKLFVYFCGNTLTDRYICFF
jgi:hypothetical protein